MSTSCPLMSTSCRPQTSVGILIVPCRHHVPPCRHHVLIIGNRRHDVDMMSTWRRHRTHNLLCVCRHSGHYACHWCWIKGKWESGINRMVYGDYKRLLKRRAPGRGNDTLPQHKPRTHKETDRIGREGDEHVRLKLSDASHPKHDSGIRRWCPLAILPLFDLIRDILPDMMHIIKNFFDGHFIRLFKGTRPLAAPKFKSKEPVLKINESVNSFAARVVEYKTKVQHIHAFTCPHAVVLVGYVIFM
jgi:hypothetical protein